MAHKLAGNGAGGSALLRATTDNGWPPHACPQNSPRLPFSSTPPTNTSPEPDLDDDGLGSPRLRADDSDEDDFGARRGPSHAAPERARLRAAPDVGAEYAGRRVSAAEAFGDGEDESELSDDGDDDALQPSPSRSATPPTTHTLTSIVDTLAGDDAILATLDAQFAAADAAAADAGATLAARAARDAAKGAAVAAQRTLWERALETRILLQKAVAASNKLPRPPALAAAARGGEEHAGVATAAATTACAAAGAVASILEVATVLADRAAGREEERHGGGGNLTTAAPSPPTSSSLPETHALWLRLEAALDASSPARDAAFDRWHRKASLLAGGGAALAGGLRVLDAPPSRQVAAAVADPARLIARSRLPLEAAPRRVGEGWPRPRPAEDPEAPGAVVRDDDTFDDGEFYAQLLKEFVEGAGGGGGSASARAPAAKRRKTVDRRASKGRKLRYDVHDKLVGFMAATEEPEPPLARQLCGALFGGVRWGG